jgi:hypothetical protein
MTNVKDDVAIINLTDRFIFNAVQHLIICVSIFKMAYDVIRVVTP